MANAGISEMASAGMSEMVSVAKQHKYGKHL